MEINLDQIGYYLYMDQQEQEDKKVNDEKKADLVQESSTKSTNSNLKI